MELQEYIKETLVQVMAGVSSAQEVQYPNHGQIGNTVFELIRVKFDIVITTMDSEGQSAKAGIFVGGFAGIGVKKDDTQTTQASNRMQFEIPVQLPIAKAE